jgi:hypothetical protein
MRLPNFPLFPTYKSASNALPHNVLRLGDTTCAHSGGNRADPVEIPWLTGVIAVYALVLTPLQVPAA